MAAKLKQKYKNQPKGAVRSRPLLPPKRGRPTISLKKTGPHPICDGPIGLKILERIAAGETLMRICKEEGMPEARTVQIHILRDPDFAALYAEAKSLRNDTWAEQLKEIGSDPLIGEKTVTRNSAKDGITETTETYDAVDRARLHSDNIKWLLPRYDPERYGDKLTTQNTNNTNLNMRVEVIEVVVVKPGMKTITNAA